MTQRFITPSKITAWLDCAHYLTLKNQLEDETREAPHGGLSAFARLLMDKGMQHEKDCLSDYKTKKPTVFEVPAREPHEPFTTWTARVGNPMADGHDVIYQMPLMHDGIRGIADFLVKVVDEDGLTTYEPVDAKLSRKEAKPGHVLQLCFYADAIEAMTTRRPRQMHLWLGSGATETLRIEDFAAYWRRLRGQLKAVLDREPLSVLTRPEPCDHCAFCEFADICDAQWRQEDSLHYVAGLRSGDRPTLEAAGISTLAALAQHSGAVTGLRPERLVRLTKQASLQYEAVEGELPPYEAIDAGEDPVWGRGFETLPEPDDGDVFLDFEGHPFWTAAEGLFFLFGLIAQEVDGSWGYVTWWAHTPEEETTATAALIAYLAERRTEHPGMHIYHYNHTERSALTALAEGRGVGEVALAHLVDTDAFIDLYLVVRNAVQVGAESYGLKVVERLAQYERGHDIDQGAGAVLEYERFMKDGATQALDRIAAYNEDDVRATRALREWLVAERPEGLAWRSAELAQAEDRPEPDEHVTALHAFGTDTAEHLLGDILGYWRREYLAYLAPKLAACGAELDDVLKMPDAIGDLKVVGPCERIDKRGKPLTGQGMRFTFPPQDTSAFKGDDKLLFARGDEKPGYSKLDRLDLEARELDLTWSDANSEIGIVPRVIVRDDWVRPNPKPESLAELAARMLDPAGPPANPVSLALLRRDLPAFVADGGPKPGVFTDGLEEMLAWATQLDRTCVAIQGPPGTGKTFRGAHLIHRLILAGKRVGITAFSHHAIDNLLEATVQLFRDSNDLEHLRAVRKNKTPSSGGISVVKYTENNKKAAQGEFNLVAGTSWLFAGDPMFEAPVDVLLIDEAGQLSLADALAASRSAHNLILLGDPLQLPQVAQASHPRGSGASVLEHILGEDRTMPTDRGVFLTETRRMHPDVCTFISEEIYESRLTSHPSCAVQDTEIGTGLRWLRATHTGRVTESPEEAAQIFDAVASLIGKTWTDQHGATKPLGTADILVVAPYNDQVKRLRALLDDDPRTRGVAVGTVDKFQGRQAAVIFFTMTTSSASDMHRSADFLFSRNRLNVAISRARCLAYLVCTEELLNSRGRDVEEMRLISTLCAFVEQCESQANESMALPH